MPVVLRDERLCLAMYNECTKWARKGGLETDVSIRGGVHIEDEETGAYSQKGVPLPFPILNCPDSFDVTGILGMAAPASELQHPALFYKFLPCE